MRAQLVKRGPWNGTAVLDLLEEYVSLISCIIRRTYKNCDIFPGPYLNLIYGPNGSGKSSIVCAICLGLGGKPGFLGRAREISEYVMYGEKNASIEVELMVDNSESLVIIRNFESDKRHSTWLLNGNYVTEKRIVQTVLKFGININNLCQVLPQDRVADFTRMNSKELLLAVEKSVDNGSMFELHRKLIDKFLSTKNLKQDYATRLLEVQKVENKVMILQDEMDKVKEYQENIKILTILEQKFAWMLYDKAKTSVDEFRQQIQTKIRELDDAKSKVDSQEAVIRAHQNDANKCKDNVTSNAAKLNDFKKDIKAYHSLLDKHTDKVHKSKMAIQDIGKLMLEREDNIKSLKEQISSLKLDLETAKNDINKEAVQIIDDAIKEKLKLKRSFQHRFNEMVPKKNQLESKLRSLNSQLNDLNDSSKQLLDFINSIDRDTYKAILWLRDNKHLFKDQITEPLLLHINVVDANVAKYLECHIPRRDFLMFLCHNRDDMDKFILEVRTKLNLRVSIGPVDINVPEERYQPIVNGNELKDYRLKCYLKDTFKCPKTVLYYLYQTYNIHNIPIFPDLNDDKLEKLCSHEKISAFYTNTQKYVIKKSAYSKNSSVNVSFLKSNKLLSGRNADQEQLATVTNSINETKLDLEELSCTIERENRKLSSLLQEIKQLENDKRSHKECELRVVQLQSKLEIKENRLKSLAERDDLASDKQKHTETIATTYQGLLKQIPLSLKSLNNTKVIELVDEVLNEKLEMLRYQKLAELAKCEKSKCYSDYNQIKSEIDRMKENLKSLQLDVSSQLRNAQKSSNYLPNEYPSDELLKEFEDYPSVEQELISKINELKSIISCCVFTDSNIIENYEQNKKLLELLQNEIAETKNHLDNVVLNETALANDWLTKVNNVIDLINGKFQENFQRINCQGKIVLEKDKDGNYENYGIEIWVKYREEQSLSRLDSMRQSGGEKSVATMLFLMSLQHISHAPIRIVDEINQGMDEINERAMFKIMVETIATLKNSQYFFLSPKSLPDLEYDPKMTILTIFNGPHLKKKFHSRKRDHHSDSPHNSNFEVAPL